MLVAPQAFSARLTSARDLFHAVVAWLGGPWLALRTAAVLVSQAAVARAMSFHIVATFTWRGVAVGLVLRVLAINDKLPVWLAWALFLPWVWLLSYVT